MDILKETTIFNDFSSIKTSKMANVMEYLLHFLLICLMFFFLVHDDHQQLANFPLLSFNNLTLELQFYFDHLVFVMGLLVLLINFVVQEYAKRYLQFDTRNTRFISQQWLVVFSVLFFIFSGNLLTAFIGWQFIGLNLYLLLNHYHFDSNANRAAKKKFCINRVGDLCFLLAVAICYQHYGSSHFELLTKLTQDYINIFNVIVPISDVILSLIFISVMTKAAQFPFHIWLPDTMQTPTPVSALMHAGVINAGGFLLARLSFAFNHTALLNTAIFMVGLTTLVLGLFFLLTQSDIKKQLAYSTMSQMGYMVMQCGLGCFSAALFHLITHGLFKAYSFLNAGNVFTAKDKARYQQQNKIMKLGNMMMSIFISIFLLAITLPLQHEPQPLLNFFVAITLTQLIFSVFSFRSNIQTKIILIGFFLLALVLYQMSLSLFTHFLQADIAISTYSFKNELWLIFLALMIFYALGFLISKPLLSKSKLGKILFCLSLNKLFIEEIYRHFLLNPLRKLGDITNQLLNQYGKSALILGAAILICFYQSNYLLSFALVSLLFFLICANRPRSMLNLICLLFLAQLSFILVGYSSDLNLGKLAALFQMFNMVLVFGALYLLCLRGVRQKPNLNVESNSLSIRSVYISILLFSLIGLPGTASFISELLIFINLLNYPAFIVVLFVAALLLLAVVILHALQDYVFSIQAIDNNSQQVSITTHIFCLMAITLNILNGMFPMLLINQLIK